MGMDDEHANESADSSTTSLRLRLDQESQLPQVCDRCRLKKVGCDGARPSCGKCLSAKVPCTISVRLQRKTKPRKYVPPEGDLVKRLKADNQSLRDQLKALSTQQQHRSGSSNVSAGSPVGLAELTASQPQSLGQNSLGYQTNPQGQRQAPTDSYRSSYRPPDPVIKHLGRLVSTNSGVERFAGTTTGVHFIHSAEQKYQQLFSTTDVFTESVFRLHMLPQPMGLYSGGPGLSSRSTNQSPNFGLRQQRSYYLPKVNRFFRRWHSIFPVLAPKQFYDGFDRIFNHLEVPNSYMDDEDIAKLHQLYLILAIDGWDDVEDDAGFSRNEVAEYFDSAQQTHLQVAEKGDLSSLQSLVLSSIFLQLSGQHSLLSQTSGMAVRLAQSLGLHRHTRRFRFCVGELEMRNRIWWCVYIIDLLSSIAYGLPKLISDADVDTDYPLDRDFDDMTATELPLPLPGEATRFSIFLGFARLSRIMSACVKQLYTTTLRRGGVEKIAMLDRELRVWQQKFQAAYDTKILSAFDNWEGQTSGNTPAQRLSADDHTFVIPYLRLMGSLAMLLIHQPALTFGPEYPQFEKSLAACAQSSMSIINTFDKNQSERRLFYLQPNGARLIFQSALMCLYCSWNFKLLTVTSDETSSDVPINHIVDTAIHLLEYQISESSATNPRESTKQNSSPAEILSSTILALGTLSLKTQQLQKSDSTTNLSPISVADRNRINAQQAVRGANDIWQPSALNSLNQLDMLEWSTDLDTGSLDSYLMDYSFPQ